MLTHARPPGSGPTTTRGSATGGGAVGSQRAAGCSCVARAGGRATADRASAWRRRYVDVVREVLLGLGEYELHNALDNHTDLLLGGLVTNESLYLRLAD